MTAFHSTADLIRAAQYRWLEIHPALGIPAEYLTNKHRDCFGCGGTNRFRWDDRDGRGTFVCGGGGNTLTGDGFDLLMHVHGWTRQEAFQAVKEYLGLASTLPPRKTAQRPVEPARTASSQGSTGDYAKAIWARVNRDDSVVSRHPYCVKKGIAWAAGAGRGPASGSVIGRNSDTLIIPIRDIRTDAVVAVQCINAEGQKQSFGTIRGHAFICGNTLDKDIPWFVCEGWADAVSLVFHAHQGNAAAFACMGHHFDLVAQTVAEHFAPQRLVILEDAS